MKRTCLAFLFVATLALVLILVHGSGVAVADGPKTPTPVPTRAVSLEAQKLIEGLKGGGSPYPILEFFSTEGERAIYPGEQVLITTKGWPQPQEGYYGVTTTWTTEGYEYTDAGGLNGVFSKVFSWYSDGPHTVDIRMCLEATGQCVWDHFTVWVIAPRLEVRFAGDEKYCHKGQPCTLWLRLSRYHSYRDQPTTVVVDFDPPVLSPVLVHMDYSWVPIDVSYNDNTPYDRFIQARIVYVRGADWGSPTSTFIAFLATALPTPSVTAVPTAPIPTPAPTRTPTRTPTLPTSPIPVTPSPAPTPLK